MHDVSARQHPGHAALRRGRRSIAGQAYLITAVTRHRRPWFARWPVALAVARELGSQRLWRDNRVQAWVLMPDHMHVVLTIGEAESLSHLMNRVKSVSARAARVVTGSRLPFWGDAFHDHALRSYEQINLAARYVIANPVRAAIVESLWDWPFWDCEWLPEPVGGAFEISRDANVRAWPARRR